MLQKAWEIKRWGALPESGGLLDQPAGLLQKAAILSDVYTAHRSYRDALTNYKGEQLGDWERRNDSIMKMLAYVRELKKKHGN